MSSNLQEVFRKFGFKREKERKQLQRHGHGHTQHTHKHSDSEEDDHKQKQQHHHVHRQQVREHSDQQQKQRKESKMQSNGHSHRDQHRDTQRTHSTHSREHHHSQSQSSSTKHSSRKRGSHPNGEYRHLKPTQFTANMSTQQIQTLMGLRAPPMYKTDEKGYIEFQPGLFIRNHFVLLDTLGRGTFSKVFEAVDVSDQTKCAIKVIRNTHRYIEAAKTELRVLQHLTNADDGTSACIHLKDHFSWQNHPCFVFKLYGPSIYTIMSRNRFRAFPDCIARSLTYQICNAIQFLHHLGIIFTDLKPENMVFVDGRTYPVKLHGKTHLIPIDSRIKIVDFGSAVYEPRYDANNPKTWKFKDGYNYLIQTRHYRAPEVVLEMPWKRPVDVWSVGCVVLEFLYGSMVFNTHCPVDHLNQMQKMIGSLPRDLIRSCSDGKYKQLFHHPDGTLRLEDARRSRAQAKRLDNYFNLHKLEHRHLYDLVSRCLKWRASQRIYGHQLLKHEYFHFIKNILTHQHKFTLSQSESQLQSAANNKNTF